MYNGILVCDLSKRDRRNFFTQNLIASLNLDDRISIEVQDIGSCNYSKNIDKAIDFVIQDCDQSLFCKTPYFDIGIFEGESKEQPTDNLKFLDCCVVPNVQQMHIARTKLHQEKVAVVKPTLHFELEPKRYDNKISQLIFYCTSIESAEDILLGYFSEFSSNDNVALGFFDHEPQRVMDLINDVKQKMNLYGGEDRYADIIIFPNQETAHRQGHIFLDMSETHIVNEQLMIATKFGNPVMMTSSNGMLEWFKRNGGADEDGFYVNNVIVVRSDDAYVQGGTLGFKVNSCDLSRKMSIIAHPDNRKGLLESMKAAKTEHNTCVFNYRKEDSIGELVCLALSID